MRTIVAAAAEAASCVRCPLADSRTQVVYGAGDPNADLVIIGEAPGREEDLSGTPFVGRAGELLTSALSNAGLPRETVYIANTLKCRPPENRDPAPSEIDACRPWLDEQLELINPLLIVTLGNFATKLLLATEVGITKLRGVAQPWNNRWLLPTLHPSYVLRGGPNGANARAFAQDLSQAASLLVRLRAERKVSPS